MCQLTWPTCVLVYIQRQQTSRQFDTVTSKDFVLAFGVLPICIYVKRPRTSHYSRVAFVLAFSILTFLCLSRQEAEDLSSLACYFCVFVIICVQYFVFHEARDLSLFVFSPFLWLLSFCTRTSRVKMKRLRHFYPLWKYSPKGPSK